MTATTTAPMAEFNDGLTARRTPVDAAIEGAALTLRDPGGAVVATWPLADIRRVPEPGWRADELRIMKSSSSDARATLRDPALITALDAAAPRLRKAPRASGDLRRALAAWALVAVGSVAAIVFVAAPLLADQIAEAVPPESELALGQTLADEITENGAPALGIQPGVCEAPEGVAALARLTERLESVAGAHLPLTVRVLDGDLVNAFAMPGGQVFLMEGLILAADSPEEVAGVLAHEIGHVVARDPTRSALRSVASGAVVAYVLGDVVGGLVAASMVTVVIDARYSRDAETSADQTAIRMLKDARLPLEPFAGFFARLRAEFGDGGGYLDTHPVTSEREAAVRAEIVLGPGMNHRPALTGAEWLALRRICDG